MLLSSPIHPCKSACAILFILSFVFIAPCASRAAQLLNVIEQNGKLFVGAPAASIRYDLLTGRFHAFRSTNEAFLQEAFSAATVAGAKSGEKTQLTLAGDTKLNWYLEEFTDGIGAGGRVVITRRRATDTVELVNTISYYKGQPGILVSVSIKNLSKSPMRVLSLSPVKIDPALKGALFLGISPENVKILQANDRCVPLCLNTRGCKGLLNSCSFDTISFWDEKAARGLAASFITHKYAVDTINAEYDPAAAAHESDTDRAGYSLFQADCDFGYSKALAPGATLESDTLALLPSWTAPFQELDTLGRFSALIGGITKPVSAPAVFSYRPGPGGETETRVQLELAARNLGPYGLSVFKINRGWEDHIGDWNAGPGFPSGMADIAKQIHEKNLKAGIRIAPFVADENSAVFRAHPDWLLDKTPEGKARGVGYPFEGDPLRWHALLLSKPEVRDYITKIIRRVTGEWGFDYIEIDFTGMGDRETIDAIRAAAGPNVTIAAANTPAGITNPPVDVMRILAYGYYYIPESDYYADKTLLLSAARLFYLNGRTRINHPGNILFKSDIDEPPVGPAQTDTEETAVVSAIALLGDVVETSAPADKLSLANLDMLRRAMPAYPRSAAPLDIFDKKNPEVLSLKVTSPWGKWNVIGLFNLEKRGAPAATSTVMINFADLGLAPKAVCLVYDFWNDEFVGVATGAIVAEVPASGARVLSIRELRPVPQLLSSNRHITMGGIEIPTLEWDEKTATLSGTLNAVQDFPHHLAFYIPAPWKFTTATIENNTPTPTLTEGPPEILDLKFTPAATGTVKWSIGFTK